MKCDIHDDRMSPTRSGSVLEGETYEGSRRLDLDEHTAGTSVELFLENKPDEQLRKLVITVGRYGLRAVDLHIWDDDGGGGYVSTRDAAAVISNGSDVSSLFAYPDAPIYRTNPIKLGDPMMIVSTKTGMGSYTDAIIGWDIHPPIEREE